MAGIAKIIPVQWPIKAIAKTVTITAANTPVLLMAANIHRTFYAISNNQLTYTVSGGTINYTVFDVLFFSFDQPVGGNPPIGLPILPGGLEISAYGEVPQQAIWVWSPLTSGSAPVTVLGYEGINDPDFNPVNLT